jgi:hypothetical protein
MKWADSNQIGPEETEINRSFMTWEEISRRLPGSCRRWALMITKGGSAANGVVIATNDSVEDMKRAENLERIRTVQKVLELDTLPKWYKIRLGV